MQACPKTLKASLAVMTCDKLIFSDLQLHYIIYFSSKGEANYHIFHSRSKFLKHTETKQHSLYCQEKKKCHWNRILSTIFLFSFHLPDKTVFLKIIIITRILWMFCSCRYSREMRHCSGLTPSKYGNHNHYCSLIKVKKQKSRGNKLILAKRSGNINLSNAMFCLYVQLN